jgi:hypothetical protein
VNDYYCTSYCNHGHSLQNGRPLNHECYVLPPKALALEMHGKTERAIEVIEAAKPLRVHPGTRCRHVWVKPPIYTHRGLVGYGPVCCTRCGLPKEFV